MKKKCRGFQCIPAKRRKEIAKMGNDALRKSGKSHSYTSETSKKALRTRKKKAGF